MGVQKQNYNYIFELMTVFNPILKKEISKNSNYVLWCLFM